MHYYKAFKASKSKSLALLIVILLLISPILLHHSSASTQHEDDQDCYHNWYSDQGDYPNPYANCTSFPCPVPEYPPDNDCTLITAINPITNTTETSTYMITSNLLRGSTLEACKKFTPNDRPDREGCMTNFCSEGFFASPLMLCEYIHEWCLTKFEVGEGEAWRCGWRESRDGPWADESLCVCSPCGVVFKPAVLGAAKREAKAKALVEVVVENRDVSAIVL